MKQAVIAKIISRLVGSLIMVVVFIGAMTVPVLAQSTRAAADTTPAASKTEAVSSTTSASVIPLGSSARNYRRCWTNWRGTYCRTSWWNGRRWVTVVRFFPRRIYHRYYRHGGWHGGWRGGWHGGRHGGNWHHGGVRGHEESQGGMAGGQPGNSGGMQGGQ